MKNRRIKKFEEYMINESDISTLLYGLIGVNCLVEIFGLFAHSFRSKYNKIRDVEELLDVVDGGKDLNIEVKSDNITISGGSRRHSMIIKVDLNTKKLIVDTKYRGIFRLKDSNSLNLTNADIYNICFYIRNSSDYNVDYNVGSNSFEIAE
jgi:hypothetical protein